MSMTKDQILSEAMALRPQEREALAEEILLSLTEADAAEIEAAWLAEVKSRDAAYCRGEIRAHPVDEVKCQ